MEQDYSKTLNLPQTDFPMRASLPQKEPTILEQWEKLNLYDAVMKENEGKPLYILHDGPPYANGDIHMGHALNKVLKDILVKYKNLNGYKSPYVPGWDTHGLPIEHRAINKLGINRHEVRPADFRRICRDFALSFVDIQKGQFKRMGVMGDWDHPYVTLAPEFEAKQIEVFGEMAKKGYIYKGLRPVYWCPDCETALADAEIEYAEDKNVSIYVKFQLKDDKGKLFGMTQGTNTYFVIWTTTTWTLPGNMAICLNGEFDYSLVKAGNEHYVVASDLVSNVMKAGGIEDYQEIAKLKGEDLEGLLCSHPFLDRDSVIILGEHVTLEAGTGCVHTAPGHGEEDFNVGKKYNLDVVVPVNNDGVMTNDAGQFAGLHYKKANVQIREWLKENNYLFAEENIIHQYPHCWRCKHPILFRATEQWFASIDGFREKALEAIKDVNWVPTWGEERITNMVRDRGDWCISRQRLWGVPIPIFYCKDCGKELINDETIRIVKELFKNKGSDSWFEMDANDILPSTILCEKCGSGSFRKETDIMDVWFDSGSSHSAVLETRGDLKWPADLYLEGSDQHRGWFQSSLLTSVATKGTAPYKTVLTHGFLVDGEGRKMSKSLGNGVDPLKVIEEFGADILRLWVISADYRGDMRISQDIIKKMTEIYRKIRNTARYILGNIYDFEPNKDAVEFERMAEIDRWALLRLNKLIEKVTNAYDSYEFNVVYHSIHSFCVVEMSNFYLDIIKDRLYTELPKSIERRSAQTAMYEILNAMTIMLAPVLAFTCEEIWDAKPLKESERKDSVLLNKWPIINEKYANTELDEKWNKILELRSDVSKALEIARDQKVIGHSLNAQVNIYCTKELADALSKFNELDRIFIVSKVEVMALSEAPQDAYSAQFNENVKVSVSNAPGEKCERCWNYSTETGINPDHPALCPRCTDVVDKL